MRQRCSCSIARKIFPCARTGVPARVVLQRRHAVQDEAGPRAAVAYAGSDECAVFLLGCNGLELLHEVGAVGDDGGLLCWGGPGRLQDVGQLP